MTFIIGVELIQDRGQLRALVQYVLLSLGLFKPQVLLLGRSPSPLNKFTNFCSYLALTRLHLC